MFGAMTMLERAAVARRRAPMRLPSGGPAGVAELADALDLGSSDENRGGSNPPARTTAALWPNDQMDVSILR